MNSTPAAIAANWVSHPDRAASPSPITMASTMITVPADASGSNRRAGRD